MLSFLLSFLTIPELLGFCINYPSVCKSYILLYLMFSYIKYIREKNQDLQPAAPTIVGLIKKQTNRQTKKQQKPCTVFSPSLDSRVP